MAKTAKNHLANLQDHQPSILTPNRYISDLYQYASRGRQNTCESCGFIQLTILAMQNKGKLFT